MKVDVTIQAIETIHAVSKRIELPNEFLRDFISRCVSFDINSKEMTLQVSRSFIPT
jgi:hypothetical protein